MFVHDESIVLPKLRQQNLAGGRVYLVESGRDKGSCYPSITRVLAAKPKPQLEAWKKRIGTEKAAQVSRAATTQGSSLHAAVEKYLNNEPIPRMMPNVMQLWSYLRPWVDRNITKVYRQETDVYSHKFKVAGRFDLLGDVDTLLSVIDFKTANREKKDEWLLDYKLQGTFYACAVYELTGKIVKRIVIPVVHPDGLQEVRIKPMEYFDILRERIDEFYLTTTV